MLTSLKSEFDFELEDIEEYKKDIKVPRSISLVTGYAAKDSIASMCKMLCEQIKGLYIKVYPIKNNFFGKEITVSGLLTGEDIYDQLKDKNLYDELILPPNVLRAEGDLFLCGMSLGELSGKLGVNVRLSKDDGRGFISTLLGI